MSKPPRNELPALDDLRAVKNALMDGRGTSTGPGPGHYIDVRLSADHLGILNELINAILDDDDPREKYWELKGRPRELGFKKLYAVILLARADARGERLDDKLFESVAAESELTFDVVAHLCRDEIKPLSATPLAINAMPRQGDK
jgi:hypothetical protein